ncbi:MAG: ACP S-malonyltransferase [Planctomycetales bacterium]|nr:ACP S-malonyltransferase [Planctomycetales bacterium]
MSKIAFLFPGQGAQVVGMGQALAADVPAAAERFAEARDVLGYDLAEICFSGPAERLNSTVYSQPALFVCSLAAVEKLRRDRPDVVDGVAGCAGLSLGEYTALVFAGAMSFADGLRVVKCRGEAMQAAADASSSGMVSVLGIEPAALEKLCDESRQPGEVLQIANYLCPGNLVCSGHQASCEELTRRATAAGAMKVIPLTVAGAFHTPVMASAVERLGAALADCEIKPPRLPVVSNVDAEVHTDPEELRSLLMQQVVNPVRWETSMRRMLADGFNLYYEVGPGKVLRGLLKRIERKIPCEGVLDE